MKGIKIQRWNSDIHPIPEDWDTQLFTLWEEDDATLRDPDAEKLDAAWRRIFGDSPPPAQAAIRKADHGDWIGYLFPDGRVWSGSYCGHAIHRLQHVEREGPDPADTARADLEAQVGGLNHKIAELERALSAAQERAAMLQERAAMLIREALAVSAR